jgi:Fe2+ transport system protein FeoA
MLGLELVPIGVPVRIASLSGSPEFVERMEELGLVPGTVVTVVRRAPLGKTLQLHYGSTLLAIRLPAPGAISVEVIEVRRIVGQNIEELAAAL